MPEEPTGTTATPTPTSVDEKYSGPLLCLGAPRTGTASMIEALRILGYKNCHHGWEITENLEQIWQWKVIDRASDATFPNLPTYRNKPFSRAEWDEIFGAYDAVSDVAALYATSIIPAYPGAKVILIERDVDRWYKSVVAITKNFDDPKYRSRAIRFGKFADFPVSEVCFRMWQGWTGSESPNDIHANLKSAFIRHNEYVKEAVPAENLLKFNLGDGWGPLCQFLGTPVPDVPFPHVNDAADYKARQKRLGRKLVKRAAAKVFRPW